MGPASPQRDLEEESPRAPDVDLAEIPAFADLYEAHFDFVWRTLRRNGVGPGALDDAVQDVFLTVAQRLPTFDPARGPLRSWLYGVTMHTAMNARRRWRRKDAPCVSADDGALERLPSTAPPPYDAAVLGEELRLVDELLTELEPDRREVLVLAELEEMSVVEIAASLGLNVNTTYSRLRAARKDLDAAVARRRAEEARRGWR